jgi:predicted RNase H-like HicB family nuclease
LGIASHGHSEEEALRNLREALELYFEPPTATIVPKRTAVEVELAAA